MGPRLLRQCHELPSQLFRLWEPARCGQAVQTLPEHYAQARVVLRWVAGGEHQHHITRVGILTLELPAAQGIRQRGAGHAKGRSVQRQLQRFPARTVQCQRHRAARRLRREEINAAEGDGPVNALDLALRKALLVFYPQVERMRLRDFKVRVIDSGGTASVVRVLIESTDGSHVWTTTGVSSNIIQACLAALQDSLTYFLTFVA